MNYCLNDEIFDNVTIPQELQFFPFCAFTLGGSRVGLPAQVDHFAAADYWGLGVHEANGARNWGEVMAYLGILLTIRKSRTNKHRL